MVKIEDSKARGDSPYIRLLGDKQLGRLISKVQSASIRSGNDLLKIVGRDSPSVEDLDKLPVITGWGEGVWIAETNEKIEVN